MYKLPSRTMNLVRKNTRNRTIIKMIKKSVLSFAMKEIKKENIGELEKIIPQQPAIVFTEEEPFKLYAAIDRMKSRAYAKEGDVAPADIHVSAGPTNLLAGPAISELTKVGIPAGVEEGKIAIKKDARILKQGDKITAAHANALRKLGIQPMLVGVNVIAIYDRGMIYKKEVLSLVGETFVNQLKQAYNNAMNLSVFIEYPTKENIKALIAKAVNQAKAINAKIGG